MPKKYPFWARPVGSAFGAGCYFSYTSRIWRATKLSFNCT